MTKHFGVLLFLCIVAAAPLSAQTGDAAFPMPAVNAITLVSAPPATREFSVSAGGTTPSQRFSTPVELAANRTSIPRSPVLLAELGPAPAGTEKTPMTAPAGFSKPAGPWFWVVNTAMLASTVANAETLHNCLNCTVVPDTMHRRGVIYGIGMPVDAGVAYLGYHLREHGHRWWYVPALALTAANGFLAYHWAVNTN